MAQGGGTGQKAIDTAGNVGSGVATSALTWLVTNLGMALDPAMAKLLAGVGFVIGVAGALVYRRYAAIITRRGPHERTAYDALRRTLAQGSLPARIYSQRLQGALETVDHFLGDACMADRTLFPHAFWLRTPAPLWTARAFDRCLLFALIYPVVTILLMWVASGHVGSAELALGLSALPWWRRGLALIAVVFTTTGVWRFSGNARVWLVWIVGTGVVAGAAGGTIAGVFGFIMLIAAFAGGTRARRSSSASAVQGGVEVSALRSATPSSRPQEKHYYYGIITVSCAVAFAIAYTFTFEFAVRVAGGGGVAATGAIVAAMILTGSQEDARNRHGAGVDRQATWGREVVSLPPSGR